MERGREGEKDYCTEVMLYLWAICQSENRGQSIGLTAFFEAPKDKGANGLGILDEFNEDDTVGPPFSDILGGKGFGHLIGVGTKSGSNTVNFLYWGKFILSLNRGVTKSGVTK
eukprot:sb/3476927/